MRPFQMPPPTPPRPQPQPQMRHAPYQATGAEHLDVLHTIARWTPEQLTYARWLLAQSDNARNRETFRQVVAGTLPAPQQPFEAQIVAANTPTPRDAHLARRDAERQRQGLYMVQQWLGGRTSGIPGGFVDSGGESSVVTRQAEQPTPVPAWVGKTYDTKPPPRSPKARKSKDLAQNDGSVEQEDTEAVDEGSEEGEIKE
jgi:hypothetical protein